MEPRTRDLIRAAVKKEMPALLSPARRRRELEHLLNEADARPAMELLWQWGLWRFWSGGWRWTSYLAEALSAADGESRLGVRLRALCRSLPPDESRAALRGLQFPKKLVKAVVDDLPRKK